MTTPIFLRIYQDGNLQTVKQFHQDSIVFGRQAEVDVDLSDEAISAIHAMIEKRGEAYYLCDLGSETGTFHEGQKILDQKIGNAESMQIGPYYIEFYVGIPKPKQKPNIPASIPKDLENRVNPNTEEDKNIISVQEMKEKVTPHPASKSKKQKPDKKPQKKVLRPIDRDSIPASAPEMNLQPVRESKKTFAPPSPYKNLDEVIKASKGSLVEILVTWGDRVLTTYHCRTQGLVRIGPHPKNDIILPVVENYNQQSMPILYAGQTTRVFVSPNSRGELYQGNKKFPISEIVQQGRANQLKSGMALDLVQGEMIRLDFTDNISIYIRYVQPSPKANLLPFFGFSPGEISALILLFLISGIFYVYMQIYVTKPVEDQPKPEDIKITQFVFKREYKAPPIPQPLPPKRKKLEPRPKKIKMADKTVSAKQNQTKVKGKPGKIGEAKPKNSKSSEIKPTAATRGSNPKGSTSSNRGRGADTGKGGTTTKKDISQEGLLGAFASSGAQEKLAQVDQGAGATIGLTDSVTGAAGSGGTGNRSGGLKEVSQGGSGTSTVGIAGVGTKGKGTGLSGYGEGSLGEKESSNITLGDSEAEFVGSIDKEAVRRTVRENLRQVQACYEKELSKIPGLTGKVTVGWDIIAGGRVQNAKVISSTLNNKNVENCIVRRLRAWRFINPPKNTVATIRYPFVLNRK